ncbi:MAG: PilN domain-containing protein [Candidatus Kerfeldbacteria bacterium]|nr:PilN domain-containing protein [Candidatus Kerfeldbacteria bacterium]
MYDLNLLSPERRLSLRQESFGRAIGRTMLVVLLLVLLDSGVLFSINRVLVRRHEFYITQLASTKVVTSTGKALPVAEVTKKLNAELKALKPVADDPALENLFSKISDALPPGIRLNSFTISLTTKQVAIKGVAASRNDLQPFEEQLRNLPWLSNISTNRNLNERKDIPFDTTASLETSKVPQP